MRRWGGRRAWLALVGFIEALILVGLHYLGAFDLGLGQFGWPVVGRVIQVWLEFAGAGQLTYTAMRAVGIVKRGK